MTGTVILNYNNAGYTLDCIGSILRFNTAPVRLVAHSASYMKSSKSSGYYYATHYRKLDVFQKFTLNAACRWYNLMVDIVKAVKT